MKSALATAGFLLLFAGAASALTLESALQRTLENNPEILQAKAVLEQAAGQRLVLRANALPQFKVSGVAAVQGGHRSGSSGAQPYAFAEASLSFPLFDASIPASWRRGDLATLVAAQQLNVTVSDQLLRTRLDFYAVLYQRTQQELQRARQTRLEQNSTTQQARLEAGVGDRTATALAQARAGELCPALAAAEHDRAAAQLDLAAAMGEEISAGALPEPEGDLTFKSAPEDVAAAAARALQERPDLQLARLLVRAASEDQRIVAAQYLPLVTADFAADYIPISTVRRRGSGSPNRDDDFFSAEVSAGASYRWQIVDNGQVGGAVLRQRAVRELNEVQLHQLEAASTRTLHRLAIQWKNLAAQRGALEENAKLAGKNLSAVSETLQQKLASQLEFRDAENELSIARAGLLETAYQQNVTQAEWDRALGRFLHFSARAPTAR